MTATGARKLFGTDGIRAIAGQAPLDRTTIYGLGLALAHSLRKSGVPTDGSSSVGWKSGVPTDRSSSVGWKTATRPKVLLGRDTRESGPWIAATLAEALRQAGAEVESAGIVTTPAVAFLTRAHGFHAGVVISASHNPWQDNGIKIFGADGFKLSDALELAMEEEILYHSAQLQISDPLCSATIEDNPAFKAETIQFLIASVPGLSLSNLKIVADCANGAAAAIAPELFRRLNPDGNAEVILLNTAPDGRNINANCGALHPELVALETQNRGADLGLTFDGDADRCMLAGAQGNVINGDAILLMAARDLKARGMLTGDLVVATTMSNMGLEAALKRSGIRMLRAPVGDRYVLEEMQKHNAALGGEQSGHILFPHLATTGDGLLTALVVLDLIARTGQSIEELTADLKVFPQIIVNVKVREKKPLDSIPAVAAAIRAAEEALQVTGRVVVRYSGTEPLARVMIEAESEEAMRRHAEAITAAIRAELGD
jgi:phosphoglucosamine mutase